eukprot:IDg22028t1
MGRGAAWSAVERKHVVAAYLGSSLNSTVGVHQKGAAFWALVGEEFEKRRAPDAAPRSAKSVAATIKMISADCQKFRRAHRLVFASEPTGGVGEAEVMSMAIAIHTGAASKMEYKHKDMPHATAGTGMAEEAPVTWTADGISEGSGGTASDDPSGSEGGGSGAAAPTAVASRRAASWEARRGHGEALLRRTPARWRVSRAPSRSRRTRASSGRNGFVSGLRRRQRGCPCYQARIFPAVEADCSPAGARSRRREQNHAAAALCAPRRRQSFVDFSYRGRRRQCWCSARVMRKRCAARNRHRLSMRLRCVAREVISSSRAATREAQCAGVGAAPVCCSVSLVSKAMSAALGHAVKGLPAATPAYPSRRASTTMLCNIMHVLQMLTALSRSCKRKRHRAFSSGVAGEGWVFTNTAHAGYRFAGIQNVNVSNGPRTAEVRVPYPQVAISDALEDD